MWTGVCAAALVTASSTDTPKSIPDNDPAGVTSVVTVSHSGTVLDVNLTLTMSHPCVDDLEITITPPGGAPVLLLVSFQQGGLFNDGLGCHVNFTNTDFDDQATINLGDGTPPFAGPFNVNHGSVGNNPLARLNGSSALGVWKLKVADRAASDTGTLVGWSLTIEAGPPGLRFVPVRPCRLVDTRENLGAFGRPALAANVARSFALPQQSGCGLPATAAAYSLNVTVVPQGSLGFLTIWPAGALRPLVSTLNSIDGRIKASAAIVPAGTDGAISVFANNATELVLDINGYFIDPAFNGQALAYYPLPLCRVADTRNPNGVLGGPILAAGNSRDFPVLASNCGVPANAQAYSLNATVVPSGTLGYLTLWPAGQGRPFVSTLNALTGAIVANAAIVPAGTGGSIGAFVSSPSHLVLDIDGYFAAAGAANAQRFFTVTPCRLLDTRNAAGEFGGPALAANQSRSFRLPLANCGLPANAAAFSLAATVVPATTLGYLTLWPTGSPQPFVSTLNALDDSIVSNAAIVPSGVSGSVSGFVTNQTHLILDTNGYFAP